VLLGVSPSIRRETSTSPTPGTTRSASSHRPALTFDQVTFSDGTTGDGTGQTIAIIDAYNTPTIQNDVATFSSQFNLPQMDGAAGDPTLTVAHFSNGATDSSGLWELETALDVEWAHAIAPMANILLVQAASEHCDSSGVPTDLLAAVDYAAQQPGVVTVSMSWGYGEFPAETSADFHFTTPGITFVAASGDRGAPPLWPAISPNVVAVGGTSLSLDDAGNYSAERGWSGSGGGVSAYESKPAYQSKVTQSTTNRTSPDVSYNVDPNPGVAISYNGAWIVAGGTSAGAPQWAAPLAIADQGRATTFNDPLGSQDTLNALYSLYNPPPGSSPDFHDILSGTSTGIPPYSAGPGYDLVTGIGTPQAALLINDLLNVGGSTPLSAPAGRIRRAGPNGGSPVQPPSLVYWIASAPGLFPLPRAATSLPLVAGTARPPLVISAPDALPRGTAVLLPVIPPGRTRPAEGAPSVIQAPAFASSSRDSRPLFVDLLFALDQRSGADGFPDPLGQSESDALDSLAADLRS
jgi:hypothetical protein